MLCVAGLLYLHVTSGAITFPPSQRRLVLWQTTSGHRSVSIGGDQHASSVQADEAVGHAGAQEVETSMFVRIVAATPS